MHLELNALTVGLMMLVASGFGSIICGRAMIPFEWRKLFLPLLLLVVLYLLFSFLVTVFLLFAGAAAPTADPIESWIEFVAFYSWMLLVLIVVPVFALLKLRQEGGHS